METWVSSVSDEHDFGESERFGVRNGQECACSAKGGRMTRGGTMKPQLRGPARAAHDFDVLPQHASAVARANGLHSGLFRGEPASQMWHRIAPAQAVRDFLGGKHPVQEPLAVLLEG